MSARFAIYYAPRPDEPLATFARDWLGRDAETGHVSEPPLPSASRNRSKTGFSTPVGRWLSEASGAPATAIDLSAASRAWALRVWQAGWTGPAA